MSSVEIDVKANTNQAERAMLELTRDVDKLVDKAKRLQDRRESDRKRIRDDVREMRVSQRKPEVGVKVINNNINDLGNSLENLTNLFESFADKIGGSFSDFYAKLQMFASAFYKVKSSIVSASVVETYRGNPKSLETAIKDTLKERYQRTKMDRDIFRATPEAVKMMIGDAQKKRESTAFARGWGRVQNGWEMVPGGGIRRSYRLIPREQLRSKDGKLIPESRPGSARYNRGLLQLKYGSEVPNAGLGRFATTNGRLAGLGNIVLGGGRMAAGAIGSGISSGLAAIGGGSALVGGATLAGAAALASPVAAFGAGLSYANTRIDQGRGKAEQYDKLNAQLSQLSKNLSGGSGSANALSKEIQELAIKGITPIEGLTKGASMLMLAFKGNQVETSKWLPILADMSAGTGESVEHFAELITRANQFGTVEFEVFNQLNEKGIPIIEQLKGKFGETKEEIMKAAQAGKITSEEFMKAFEAAHKASMEGANAAQKAVTLSDLRQQTQEYEQLEASHYTEGYDKEMLNYERWRNRRAKERSEDESLRAQGEAMGAVLASITESFKRLGSHLSDFGDFLMSKIVGWTGLTDSNAKADIAQLALDNTTTSIMEDGINHLEKEGSDKRYWTSTQLSEAIKETEARRDRLYRIANDDDFDDETRAYASKVLGETKELLNNLEASYETAIKREEELAEARREAAEEAAKAKEAEETRNAFLKETAKTDKEMLEAHGFGGLYEVTKEMETIANRIKNGQGTEADRERYQELTDLVDSVREYRDKQKSDKEEAEAKQREETERLAREERAREMFRLERQIDMNPEDHESRFYYEMEQMVDKLKSLGFSGDEASQILTENRAQEIAKREKQISENNTNIDKEKQAIEDNKKTGLEIVENAWGSAGRVMTSFNSPYEQDQLKELESINDKLQEEIDALNRLDIRAYAQ